MQNNNYYDYVLRFDLTQHKKEDVNRILNKVRSLLVNEGLKLEKPSDADKEQYESEAKAKSSS